MQVNLLKIQRELGDVSMNRLGDTEGAQRYFRKAVEISRACYAKKPDDGYKGELANSLGKLAARRRRTVHLEKARDLYREEIERPRVVLTGEGHRPGSPARACRPLRGPGDRLTVQMGDLVKGQKLYEPIRVDSRADRRGKARLVAGSA